MTTTPIEIKIRCTGADSLPLSALSPLQGNLKTLTARDFQKLKSNIIEHGFVAPFFVWRDGLKNFYLDGTQRDRVLVQMMQDKAYKLPSKFPVAYIDAKDKKDAAKIILLISSRYGRMSEETLADYFHDFGLDFGTLEPFLALPDVGDLTLELGGGGNPGGTSDPTPAIYPEDDIINDAFAYFRKNGFPYPALELFEMKQQINKLAALDAEQCRRSTIGYKVADSFHPHRFHAAAQGMKSPAWAWDQDKSLRIALKMEMDAGGIRNGLMGSLSLTTRVQACANFRPAFAKMIWNKYAPKNGVVFDPCTGYGGRAVGFLASHCGCYISTDPNKTTFEGNTKLFGWLTPAGKKYHLFDSPVEDLDLAKWKNKVDVAFTSSPYFSKEIYSEEDTQSWKRYPAFDAWSEKFLRRLIQQSFLVLKPKSHLILNIEDVIIKGKTYPLVKEAKRLAQEEQFEFIGEEKFYIPKNNFNAERQESGDGYDPDQETDESVLVFRKP